MTVCGIKHADGVCVMGECPYIKMCCPAVWDKRKSEPQTNEEWLKSLNTEQLAEWINNIVDDGIIKAWMIKNNCCGDYLESVKWWLKQPHTPKE